MNAHLHHGGHIQLDQRPLCSGVKGKRAAKPLASARNSARADASWAKACKALVSPTSSGLIDG